MCVYKFERLCYSKKIIKNLLKKFKYYYKSNSRLSFRPESEIDYKLIFFVTFRANIIKLHNVSLPHSNNKYFQDY